MSNILETDVDIRARDGYRLAAKQIMPDQPKAAVLISSGTGFPKELYLRLARYGAERGYACLIYDYRGIAGSAPDGMPAAMKGFDADLVDWARLDFPAALDAAASLAPGKPLYTIGHSVGGHLLGFADNAHKARAHAFITVGTGYWGAHEPSYRPSALTFWWLYGPACLALKGYIPEGGIWGGTALPKGVFQQWRKWSQKPDYFGAFFDELGGHYFDRITAPIHSWTFSDDRLCSKRSAEDLLALYTAAPKTHDRLDPAEVGAASIDHHGAFRRAASGFWPLIFDWFEDS